MELEQFQQALDELAREAEAAFAAATSAEAFEGARVAFTGARSGQLKSLQKELGTLSKEDKPAGGKALNDAKNRIQLALDAASARLESSGGHGKKSAPSIDATLPGSRQHASRLRAHK